MMEADRIAAAFAAGICIVGSVTVIVVAIASHNKTPEQPREQNVRSISQYGEQLSGKYILISGNDRRNITCDYSIPDGDGELTHISLRCDVLLTGGNVVQ